MIFSRKSKQRVHAVTGSIVAAVIGYLVFSIWGGWNDVITAFGKVGVIGISIALFMSLINYGLRFIRWQRYLQALELDIPVISSVLIYLSGFALTTTPGKAGEMLRGVFLKARGMPYTRSTAAFISERMSDLFAIVLLALLGAVIFPQGGVVILAGVTIVGTGLLFLSGNNWVTEAENRYRRKDKRISRIIHHLLIMLIESSRCHTRPLLFFSTVLSLLAWSAEAFAFHLILYWIGFEISLPAAFSIYAISMLAGALSFLPGGLGGTEAVMVGLLLWVGMPEAEAVASTVIIRLTTLWFAVALGGMALLFGKRILNEDTDYAGA